MDKDTYNLLLEMKTTLAIVEERSKNYVSREEFTAFKTRVTTIWSCITVAVGIAGWFLK